MRGLRCAAICLAVSRRPPFLRWAVMPVARKLWLPMRVLMPAAPEAGSVLSLGSPAPITQQLGDRRAGASPIRGFHGLGAPCSDAAGAFVRRIRQRSSSGNLPSASSGQPRGIDDTGVRSATSDQHKQARQLVVAHYYHRPPTLPRQASDKPRSVTSLLVRSVTFLSVICTSKSHNIEFWKIGVLPLRTLN